MLFGLVGFLIYIAIGFVPYCSCYWLLFPRSPPGCLFLLQSAAASFSSWLPHPPAIFLLCWFMVVDVVAMFASLLSPLTAVLPRTPIAVSMPPLKGNGDYRKNVLEKAGCFGEAVLK